MEPQRNGVTGRSRNPQPRIRVTKVIHRIIHRTLGPPLALRRSLERRAPSVENTACVRQIEIASFKITLLLLCASQESISTLARSYMRSASQIREMLTRRASQSPSRRR